MCVSKWFALLAALCVVAVHSVPAPARKDNTGEKADLPTSAARKSEGPVDPKGAPDSHAKPAHVSDEKVRKFSEIHVEQPQKTDGALPSPLQQAPVGVAPQVPPEDFQYKISKGVPAEAPPPDVSPVTTTSKPHLVEKPPSGEGSVLSQKDPQPENIVQKPSGPVAVFPEGPPKDNQVSHVDAHPAATSDIHAIAAHTSGKEPQPQAPDQTKTSTKQDAQRLATSNTKIQVGPSTTPKAAHSSDTAPNPSAEKNALPQVDDNGDLPNETPPSGGLAGAKNSPEQPKLETSGQKEAPKPPSSSAAKPDAAQIAKKLPAEKTPTNDISGLRAGEPLKPAQEAPVQDEELRPELTGGQGGQEDDFSPSGFEQPSGGLDGRGPVGGQPEKPLDVSVVSPMGDGARFSGIPVEDDSHFFAYFLTAVVFCVLGYLAFHNKRKILALIVEGRHERLRRNNAAYRRLDNTDEDLGVRKGRGSF